MFLDLGALLLLFFFYEILGTNDAFSTIENIIMILINKH